MRYYAPIIVFVMAVLIPSIAMSVLALRAAEREALYVERRVETSLLAEVDLTSAGINRLITDVTESLRLGAHEEWSGNPLASTSFTLSRGRLYLSGGGESEIFRNNFEGFLLKGERLPTYELVTRVYKTSDALTQPAVKRPEDARPASPSVRQLSQSVGIARQKHSVLLETDPRAEDMMLGQAESEGFATYSRNVAPQRPPVSYQQLNAAPAPASGHMPIMEAVQAEPVQMDSPQTFRSRTVSRYRSFGELTSEASYGLLPNITSRGLELLFWTRTEEGLYAGCAVRMDVLRDMIADAMPDIISDARILTVLDDTGSPIVAPFPAAAPDWSAPFVAREISPLLPRWEVGAWLVDPGSIQSTANFARMIAWVQVAALGSLILAGSLIVIRMMSYEMRVASQKTTFVANVSHELKTPLTSIRLYAELLASGRQADEARRREYLRTMISEAERLSNLVDNVLTFSRRANGAKKDMKYNSISLADLVTETVSQFEPHLEKLGFTVTCKAGDSLGSTGELLVTGNRETLKQVVVNLLSNAEKYSGASREISVEYGRAGHSAAVRVLDRGIGVPEGMSKKIFDEFVRGDDSLSAPAGGAGLGLSIARSIARNHGGDVTYSPRDGGGSVFTLMLPIANDF
ncbi:MAG: HAMP domain-containing histidine kinase [Synergistaceae bacterium]|nr:HAMP domain-containing histidine kinase [Synergistaceae bacterium]